MESRPVQSSFIEQSLALSAATATEAISWAWREYGPDVAVLTSMQDAVLVDLALRVEPTIPIVFLDNGYHFPETLDMVRAVEDRYGIGVEVVGPFEAAEAAIAPGECCDSKRALLDAALDGRRAWISGISRVQTPERTGATLVGTDRRGLVKINPLVQWDTSDRAGYAEIHQLVRHALADAGFESIGCAPCTSPGVLRSGRWVGQPRTECGLHV